MTNNVVNLFPMHDAQNVSVEIPAVESALDIESIAEARYDSPMTDQTQNVIDLKLENMQLRMEQRFTSIEGKIDAFTTQSAGRERAIELLAERAVAAAESASNLKQTLWITSITTILAVLGIALAAYFGTQASNIAIVQTTLAAFESGRTTGSKEAQPTSASSAETPTPAPTHQAKKK